jgi:protein-disulfide isomerase
VIHHRFRMIAVLLAATFAVAAAPPKPAPQATPRGNWNATVVQGSDGAFTLGNPAAKVKLTEYVSYTCSHCAHFHQEADAKLRLSYVPQGKVAVEVEQILRNPIDLTIAMLTNCGDPKTFFTRHNAFMATQPQWLAKYDGFTPAQTARWSSGEVPVRLRAIASDFDFYAIMARWSYSRPQVDRCLGDAAVLKRVTAQTEAASALGIDSTPSFAINGEVATDVHEWKTLMPLIDAKL